MKIITATFLLVLFNIFLYTKLEIKQIESQHEIKTLEMSVETSTGGQQNGVLRHVEMIQGVEVASESNYEKQKQYIAKNFPQSPLVEYVDYIHELIPDDRQAALFLAVAGQESGFGTHMYTWNTHGVRCYRPTPTFDCGWTKENPEYGIKRTWELTKNYYSQFDGTRESLDTVFIGTYVQGDTSHWGENVWTFYQGLTSN